MLVLVLVVLVVLVLPVLALHQPKRIASWSRICTARRPRPC
jgi:hypothetical protein